MHTARQPGGLNSRLELFEEKLGFRQPFAGNEHTRRGTRTEPVALAAYEQLTGHTVQSGIGAELLGPDPDLSWLAASPDGLIHAVEPGVGPFLSICHSHSSCSWQQCSRILPHLSDSAFWLSGWVRLAADPSARLSLLDPCLLPWSSHSWSRAAHPAALHRCIQRQACSCAGSASAHLAGEGPGMLEIKCPARGPWESPPFYYMPQVCQPSSRCWQGCQSSSWLT